jgi:hypothetical protein
LLLPDDAVPGRSLNKNKQRSRYRVYQQGFTSQQALLLLLIILPFGFITLGLGSIVLQRHQSMPTPQAVNNPTIKAPSAVENNGAVFDLAIDQAISTVSNWITAMSEGDEVMARRLMTYGAKSLYSRDFFDQFLRVTVTDLQTSGISGSYVSLNGIMTFVYKDGTTQRESRSFTVRTEPHGEAQVTNTEFISVIKFRS